LVWLRPMISSSRLLSAAPHPLAFSHTQNPHLLRLLPSLFSSDFYIDCFRFVIF
jgi:hypothetical protein